LGGPEFYNFELVSTTTQANRRACVRRILAFSALSVVGAGLLLYSTDYAVFRLRTWAYGNAIGTVTVEHYYAVAQKNGKTQFIFDPPAPQTCANALFPHSGMLPCWYLRRHPEQRTDI